MIKLNLKAENDCQQAIKDYLEQNASETLASKINNGVKIEKDGKTLVNKKTLSQFWNYATKKAQEQKTGYVANETVFGWAIHYFEESEIIGRLYNSDGSEYKEPKTEVKPVPAPTVLSKPTPKKPAQPSLFDFLINTETTKEEPKEEVVEEPVEDDIEQEETLDVDEETGEILTPIPAQKSSPNRIYQRYIDIEKQYPHAVVAYRLGDFYEVFGDKAVLIAKELELTLTGRNCGLEERVPMIGFPYHASDSYFRKIRQRRKLIVVENDEILPLEKLSAVQEPPKPTPVEIPKPQPTKTIEDTDDLDDVREQTKHIDKDALCVLLELFDFELDVE